MTNKPIGLTIFQPSARMTIEMIKMAEQMGIPMAWVPSFPATPDPLTVLSAAAVQTSKIGLATGISVSYPRHPLMLVNEALTLAELAQGRFRLGIGASHPFIVEGMYGLPFSKPLAHLREYVTVVRALLWEGAVNFTGKHYRVQAQFPPFVQPPRTPIVLATVRKRMFRLAGEISDGAMVSWGPMSYLKAVALPAMEEGAKAANRPRPPLIASAPIVFATDFEVVRKAAYAALAIYMPIPAYIEMFTEAGFPPSPEGKPTDELIREMFIYGDADTIRARLNAMFDAGADEIQAVICPAKDPMAEGAAIMQIIGAL